MIKPNKIKHRLISILPDKYFKFIYSLWLTFIKPIYRSYEELRLIFFKTTKLVEVSVAGIKFNIFVSPDNGTVDEQIYLHGAYEPYFLEKIQAELKKGDVFVDIGANIGQHSLFAANVVGSAGKVISFEPLPEIYNQFNKSIAANNLKNIKVFNLGCGEKEDFVKIYTSSVNMGGSSIVEETGRSGSQTIKIVTADSILANEDKVSFIKIDVEGYEYPALAGLRATIEKFRPKILIEYSPYLFTGEHANDGEKIINFLQNQNYKILDIENKNREVSGDFNNKLKLENKTQTNFICYPN